MAITPDEALVSEPSRLHPSRDREEAVAGDHRSLTIAARTGMTVFAPWRWMFRPTKAGEAMVTASTIGFLACFLIHAVLLAALIIVLIVWSAMVDLDWSNVRPLPAPTSASSGVTAGIMGYLPTLIKRDFSEAWRFMNRGPGLGALDHVLIWIPLVIATLGGLCALLYVPDIHDAGSLWNSYRRAFRKVVAGAGVLILLTGIIGAGFVVAFHQLERRQAGYGIAVSPPMGTTTLPPLVMGGISLLIFWLSRAVVSRRDDGSPENARPLCEGCGYDLTHISADKRCSECGREVDLSLDPNRVRSGCAWQNRHTLPSWIRSSWASLFRPRRFYGAVRIRASEGSRAFVLWHYVAIGFGAMIWVVLLGWYQIALAGARITPYELWFVPVTILFAAPLLGWGVHRVVGMLAAWPWFLGKRLPDSLFAARVMAYETPFLWIFCLYNGCVVTSLTVHDIFWNSPAVRQFFAATLNLPPDVSWIAVGNLALGVIWLWRHHRAIRAVRWSNF